MIIIIFAWDRVVQHNHYCVTSTVLVSHLFQGWTYHKLCSCLRICIHIVSIYIEHTSNTNNVTSNKVQHVSEKYVCVMDTVPYKAWLS